MQPTDRLHALDAVRAYALLLGVVLHSCAPFIEGFPIPIWRDEPHDGPTVIYYVIHMFRMSAFFLMAGLFGRMVLERRGVQAFVKDRLKRVAVPLFLFGPVALIMIFVGLMLGALPYGLQEQLAAFEQLPADAPAGADALTDARAGDTVVNFAHLWFLYYLLIFYALALLLRAAVHAVDARGAVRGACDRVIAFAMRGIWAPALIASPIAVYLWRTETWAEWLGLPAPIALLPNPTALIGYGVPFALGWLLHRQLPLLMDLQKVWVWYFAAAVALTALCLTTIGVTPRWAGPTLVGGERCFTPRPTRSVRGAGCSGSSARRCGSCPIRTRPRGISRTRPIGSISCT